MSADLNLVLTELPFLFSFFTIFNIPCLTHCYIYNIYYFQTDDTAITRVNVDPEQKEVLDGGVSQLQPDQSVEERLSGDTTSDQSQNAAISSKKVQIVILTFCRNIYCCLDVKILKLQNTYFLSRKSPQNFSIDNFFLNFDQKCVKGLPFPI